MKEDVNKLVLVLIVSHVIYSTLYLLLKPREIDPIDILLQKAYKEALGLPLHTANSKLEALGVHNKVWETTDAHLVSQLERLRQMLIGCTVLSQLGYQIADDNRPRPETVPQDIRKVIRVAPFPRNIHPEHQAQRRQARVQFLQGKCSDHSHV